MPDFMRKIRHIHFVGIGGSGMSGIAEVLLNQGFKISGSDQLQSAATHYLQSRGADIAVGHSADFVQQADVVVVSAAIPADNAEIVAARKQLIPVISRAEMLAELMRFRQGIAVAGTHGKTTTTSLIASVLAAAELDPTYVIGGKLNSMGSNARLGAGRYFVAEADESDASFLLLKPMTAVVTNIDRDHMTTYQGDFHKVQQTFLDFLHHLPFYGLAVLCLDDPVLKELLPQVQRPVLTYGFSHEADWRAYDYQQQGLLSHFKVVDKKGGEPLQITLKLPGRHNVYNALAAIAVAKEVGVSHGVIRTCLDQFAGIGRRFQVTQRLKLRDKHISLVDDYGHHPKEIAATVEAIRAVWPQRRLLTVFQPHRYTRTYDLFDDFAATLSTTDLLLLLEVYSAGEAPIRDADSRALARAIRQRARVQPIYVTNKEDLWQALLPIVEEDDIILMQGAGNIGELAQLLVQQPQLCEN